ncbi:hypothetical protein XPN_0799 [Xanthomonas arboricola pv. pruni MAFF 301427]|nr:hypothetical protein XPN_0799 [Xanthomonas arboricola pv. pruni MAFF 301427]
MPAGVTAAATALAVWLIGAGNAPGAVGDPLNSHQAAPATTGTASSHGQREDLDCIVELLTSTTSRV